MPARESFRSWTLSGATVTNEQEDEEIGETFQAT
jgi:hypothetical protein